MTKLRKTSILLFLMLLLMPMAMKAEDAFYIESQSINPGDTATLYLSLNNSIEYRGFQADLVLPTGLSVVKKSSGSYDISLTSRASSTFLISSNALSTDTVRMVCFSLQNDSFTGQSGQLVKIQIKASDDFTGGEVSLSNIIFANTNDEDVEMADFKINVAPKSKNYLTVNDGTLSAGSGQTFPVLMNNETALSAYQLDVVVPSGITIDLNKCSMSDRCTSSHMLSSKDMGSNTYRFVCLSLASENIAGTEGALLNLWIQADSTASGEKTVNIKNIIFSDADAKQYDFDATSFKLNVTAAVATSISLNESSATLKIGEIHQLQATVLPANSSNKDVIWESSDNSIASVDANGNVTAVAAGQCTITAYTSDRNLKATCAITVEKLALTAKVENASKVYGDANPGFKISYTGFADGDSEDGFSVKPTIATVANNLSNVGDYDITASGAVSDKYAITYVAGTLTIAKAPLTISAGEYTIQQGDAIPEFSATYSGFKNDENESVLTKAPTFSTDATESSVPGEYTVTVSGAEAQNYEISYVQGTLTIKQTHTGVEGVESEEEESNDWYTISGVKLTEKPQQKGIYINGHKKVVIK